MAGWSEEICLQLIELYKENELLWNTNLKEYLRKNLKEDAWRNISVELGKSPEDCKAKMSNLTASWRRERKKVFKTTTGQGANETYVSRWYAFQALEFLSDRNKPRMTLNSEDPIIIKSTYEDSNSENIDDPGSVQGDTPGSIQGSNPGCVQGGSSTSKDCFASPTVVKQNTHKKPKLDEHSAMMTGAYDILKTAAEKLKTTPPVNDETTSFFNYVSAKVRNYSSETKKAVQHAIFEILMKADQGYYDWADMQNQYAYQPNYGDNRYSQSSMPQPGRPVIQASPRVSPSPLQAPAHFSSPSPYSISSTASSPRPSPVNGALNMSLSSHQQDRISTDQFSLMQSTENYTDL